MPGQTLETIRLNFQQTPIPVFGCAVLLAGLVTGRRRWRSCGPFPRESRLPFPLAARKPRSKGQSPDRAPGHATSEAADPRTPGLSASSFSNRRIWTSASAGGPCRKRKSVYAANSSAAGSLADAIIAYCVRAGSTWPSSSSSFARSRRSYPLASGRRTNALRISRAFRRFSAAAANQQEGLGSAVRRRQFRRVGQIVNQIMSLFPVIFAAAHDKLFCQGPPCRGIVGRVVNDGPQELFTGLGIFFSRRTQ